MLASSLDYETTVASAARLAVPTFADWCAVDLLVALRPHARIGIVSNNLLEEQRDKLAFCGLAPYVDVPMVSFLLVLSLVHEHC